MTPEESARAWPGSRLLYPSIGRESTPPSQLTPAQEEDRPWPVSRWLIQHVTIVIMIVSTIAAILLPVAIATFPGEFLVDYLHLDKVLGLRSLHKALVGGVVDYGTQRSTSY